MLPTLDPLDDTSPHQPVTIDPPLTHIGCRRFLPLLLAFGLLVILAGIFSTVAWWSFNRVTVVTVIASGDSRQVETRASTVGGLLAELGLRVSADDRLTPSAESALQRGMIVRIDPARKVTLTVDGSEQILLTTRTNPGDILAEADVTLAPGDQVTIDGSQVDLALLNQWTVPAVRITVQHARPLLIDDDGIVTTLQTTQATVGEALYAAGYTLYLADNVSPTLYTPVQDVTQVVIKRSRPVTILADGAQVRTRTHGLTVGDALADAGVALVGLDYSIPAEDIPLAETTTVRVVRVREEVLVEWASLPFETIVQADPALELDTTTQTQAGQNGIEQSRIRVRYEDGAEVRRRLEETIVLRAPVNRVVTYGTSIVLRSVDTPAGSVQYWRRLRMYATSYSPQALGGDNVTATGRTLTYGVVAIDPGIVPYGTQVYVPDYGIGIAADTGGPRRSRLWIDLGYDDFNYVSWSRYVDVYLLAPPPATIPYVTE